MCWIRPSGKAFQIRKYLIVIDYIITIPTPTRTLRFLFFKQLQLQNAITALALTENTIPVCLWCTRYLSRKYRHTERSWRYAELISLIMISISSDYKHLIFNDLQKLSDVLSPACKVIFMSWLKLQFSWEASFKDTLGKSCTDVLVLNVCVAISFGVFSHDFCFCLFCHSYDPPYSQSLNLSLNNYVI